MSSEKMEAILSRPQCFYRFIAEPGYWVLAEALTVYEEQSAAQE